MQTKQADTLILGAGPAGLSAGYTLARLGHKPVILEKGQVSGGLMRSVKRGEFTLDIGRKELYNRLAKVDAFWGGLLGKDFRQYPHRGGILFDGHIIEISRTFRGFRRGMPWSMFAGCAADLVLSRIGSSGKRPENLEEYFYQKRGRRLSRIISQGFQEKLTGTKWADVPIPEDLSGGNDATFLRTVSGLVTRTLSKKEANTFEGTWRHPAKGTGQICELLEQGVVKSGGTIIFGADVMEMNVTDGAVTAVTVQANGATIAYRPQHIISTIPSQSLLKLLLRERFDSIDATLKAPPASKKTIVLVYLFLSEAPRFPHAWLNVTCPNTRIGRITNYAALGGDMVPQGKSALCCEFYLNAGDSLLDGDDRAFIDLAISDASRYKLVNPAACFDFLVIRLPGADASQNRYNWMNNMRTGLLHELKVFRNVYHATRTDLDIATLAGIEAAEAILSGDRETFDRHIDPANLEIRSVQKAFEFRNPAEQPF